MLAVSERSEGNAHRQLVVLGLSLEMHRQQLGPELASGLYWEHNRISIGYSSFVQPYS